MNKQVENRIQEVTDRLWNHNRCDEGGSVDKRFLRDFVTDIYETAIKDAMVILEGNPEAESGLEEVTGIKL